MSSRPHRTKRRRVTYSISATTIAIEKATGWIPSKRDGEIEDPSNTTQYTNLDILDKEDISFFSENPGVTEQWPDGIQASDIPAMEYDPAPDEQPGLLIF